MRIVVQRVSRGQVTIDKQVVGAIDCGLVVLVGVTQTDSLADATYLAEKTANLRIFPDEAGKLNRSVLDCGGQVLAVSQFTLYGDCRRGRRPSFSQAAPPAAAASLYEAYVADLKALGLTVETGVFQADMQVEIVNDGPVTLLLDSEKTF